MPADDGFAATPPAGESATEATASPESRGCILIVDDNQDNVEVLRVRLDSWGYETRTATNGAEALASVRERAPDLILLDVMMPASARSRPSAAHQRTRELSGALSSK